LDPIYHRAKIGFLCEIGTQIKRIKQICTDFLTAKFAKEAQGTQSFTNFAVSVTAKIKP